MNYEHYGNIIPFFFKSLFYYEEKAESKGGGGERDRDRLTEKQTDNQA